MPPKDIGDKMRGCFEKMGPSGPEGQGEPQKSQPGQTPMPGAPGSAPVPCQGENCPSTLPPGEGMMPGTMPPPAGLQPPPAGTFTPPPSGTFAPPPPSGGPSSGARVNA